METKTSAEKARVAHGARRPYVPIALALAMLTVVEVLSPGLPAARTLVVAVLLALATSKGSLVVLYYMHLRYEPRWLSYLPLGVMALVLLLALALSV
jgi:caa(3)-type oxidase subunit IV